MTKAKAKIKNKIKQKARNALKVKIKNKSAASKRYKVTGTGLVKVMTCGKQHNAASKNRSRKNRLKKLKVMREESRTHAYRCLPNSF